MNPFSAVDNVRKIVDLKNVRWGPTVWLNCLRAFCAGFPLIFVGMFLSWNQLGAPHPATFLIAPVFVALAYLMWVPFFTVVAVLLGAFFPPAAMFAGVMLFAFACALILGDPLVYLIFRKRPHWVPVETFRPINFTAVLYVKNPVTSEAGRVDALFR